MASFIPIAPACCRRFALSLLFLACFLQTGSAQVLPGTETTGPTEAQATAGVSEAGENSPASDVRIESRLARIFANFPELETVSVHVKDGVVILSGSVGDIESMTTAEQLAERVASPVMVINKIVRDRTIGARLKAATKSIELRFKDLAGNAPLLLLALAVIVIAFFAARLAGKAEWLFARVSANWFIRDLLRQVVQLAVIFSGVVIALKLLDATALLGSLVGAVGIVGLALGFATRDTVENYIASMLLSLRQPFRHEDYISVDGAEGKVLRLTPRATVLMSLDGNHVRIPNSKVYKATITNYTRNPLRRFDFQVGVDTGIDLTLPRELAVKTLSDLPGVLETPPALCLVQQLGDSSVILKVLGWIDQRENDYLKIRSEAQRLVKEAFDAAGIIMPEPIYNVNLRRQRPAKARAESATAEQSIDTTGDAADTKRDRAVEEQMRDEQRHRSDDDLLSKSAPAE